MKSMENNVNKKVLQNANVIAFTTTGAAKYKELLN